MKIKVHHISLAVALAMGVPGSAYAGSALGVDTKNADLEFKTPSVLTHTVTSVGEIPAGAVSNYTKFAIGNISSNSGLPQRFAFRVTPNTFVDNGSKFTWDLFGRNDKNNTITVSLSEATASLTQADDRIGAGGWAVVDEDLAHFYYHISKAGDAWVNADEYLISMDAAVWEF